MASKRKIQPLITSIFKKRNLEVDDPQEDEDENIAGKEKHIESDVCASSSDKTSGVESTETSVTYVTTERNITPQSTSFHLNDIGLYKNNVNTDKIYTFYHVWEPPVTYAFPILEKFKKRGLKFQYRWLIMFPWLAYSKKEEGAFCKYCVLFAPYGAGFISQELGSLVKTKFDNWKKATKIFRNHEKTVYHHNSVTDFKNLEKLQNNASIDVRGQIDQAHRDAVVKNRRKLKPIIDCVILCGRQELALRGHRESSDINPAEECCDSNPGNFRAILHYRSQADEELAQILQDEGRIKYLSPKIQNEIIDSCNTILLKKLVQNINASQCFSILADETSDVSHAEQFTICPRYVQFNSIKGEHIIREDFLQFKRVTSCTGESLAMCILQSLQNYGVDATFLRGQGYDGACAMSGIYNGVHKHILEKHPYAKYVHCAAHALNLAVAKACEVKEIRNCLGVLEKIYSFFSTPKKQGILLDEIEKSDLSPQVKTVKRLSCTRWISKYDAVRDFMHIMDFEIAALDKIAASDDKTASEAYSLKCAVSNTEFIISVHVIANIFAYCLPLCKTLQKNNIDLKQMVNISNICTTELKNLRANSEKEFHGIFQTIKCTAEEVGVDLKMPRICANQKNRGNAIVQRQLCDELSSLETHYRINLFNPLLDFFIMQMNERFENHASMFEGFSCLFDSLDSEKECKAKLRKLIESYPEYVKSSPEDIFIEVKLWRNDLERRGMSKVLKSVIESLDYCDTTLYPNVYYLLKILATLPVTTCTPERSFSTLKRLKTYLRNTTGQGRLNGLAMLSIHREIKISSEEVMNELAKKPRKIDLVL